MIRTIENGDVRLHVRDEGNPDGKVVFFANSLGTDLRLWDKIVDRMPPELRLIRFDKRGHGLSDAPQGPYRMEDLAGDAATILDTLGITSCVFVGLSIGGLIGQMLTRERPDLVRALVISNSAAKVGEAATWQDRIDAIRDTGLPSIADGVMERWFAAPFRATPELALWRNMLARTQVDGYIACCQAIAATDLRDHTRTLTLPVLGIGGSDDGATPPDLVRGTIDTIAGARYVEIPGTGHLPCVENPDRYTAILTDFLKEVGHV